MASQSGNKHITIEASRPAGAPIHHASYFHLTHIEGDVILDVGAVDAQQFMAALENPIDADVVIPAHISHRFGMSVSSLLQLQRRVNDIVSKLKDAGAISG